MTTTLSRERDLVQQPFVSVVTPVYNGERYLGECIESVLAQTYHNWEYVIVNNCSTDRSLEIAGTYAEQDRRIRIHDNTNFLSLIENQNHAFRQISAESAYCKILHADDLLFPNCLEEMVRIGESYPSVGLVGSYGLWGDRVVCDGVPYRSEHMSGRDLSRRTLLGEFYLFWSPTSLLVRSGIVRARGHFYHGPHLHADDEAHYEILQDWDFGFVHQVLTFIRRHDESATSTLAAPMNRIILSNLDLLVRYGPRYLSRTEYRVRLKERLNHYYRFLATSALQLREKEFWRYHKNSMSEMGHPWNAGSVMAALVMELVEAPKRSLGIFARAVRSLLTGRPSF